MFKLIAPSELRQRFVKTGNSLTEYFYVNAFERYVYYLLFLINMWMV